MTTATNDSHLEVFEGSLDRAKPDRADAVSSSPYVRLALTNL